MVDRTTTVRLRLDNSQFNRGLLESARGANLFADSVESSGSRMETLVQAAIGLGPAVVPALVGAGVAAAAFGTQLAFAATGAGVAMLAFQGVGDAVKKMDAFALAPSATTFNALHLAMEKLGPAQQQFVQFLHDAEPALHGLQRVAGENLFPGLETGLMSLRTLLPDVRSIIENTSTALGQMATEAGQAFNNPQWHEFFQFLSTQANTTLVTLGRTIGNFVQGLGSMMVAFGPLTQGFSAGLLDMSRAFAAWSAQLSTSTGFQDFIAYVQSIGPQVLDTLGAVGQAIVAIGAATAPLQGPTLAVIRALADTLSALASSPVGPLALGILQVGAAMRTLARASNWLGTSAIGSFFGAKTAAGIEQTGVAMKEAAVGAQTMGTSIKTAGAASATFTAEAGLMKAQIAELGVAEGTAAAGAARLKVEIAETAVAMSGAQASITRTTAAFREMSVASTIAGGAQGALAKLTEPANLARLKSAALGVGLVATSFSDLDDKLGVSNTAQGALLGTLIDPGLGTALGAAAGYVVDFTSANNDLDKSLETTNSLLQNSPTSFAQIAAGIQRSTQELGGYTEKTSKLQDLVGWVPVAGSWAGWLMGKSQSGEEAQSASTIAMQNQQFQNLTKTFSDLRNQTDGATKITDYTDNFEALGQTAAQAQPVLAKMGLTLQDVVGLHNLSSGPVGDPSIWSNFIDNFKAAAAALDSSAGKAHVVGAAVSDMDNDLLTAAQSAQQLGEALSAALEPGLNLSAAQDALAAGLRHFEDDIAKSSRSLTANTDAADMNRDAFRTRTQAIAADLQAMANHNAGSRSIAEEFDNQRKALIRTAVAAGFARKDVVQYLDQIGLTAQLTNAALRHAGIDRLTNQANNLHDAFVKLPKKVQTDITTHGVPQTNAQIDALKRKYDLTPKEVRTLLAIKDAASGPLAQVLARVLKFGNTTGTATADVNNRGALSSTAAAEHALNGFDGETASAALQAQDNASGTIRGATAAAQAFSGTYVATLITNSIHNVTEIFDTRKKADGGYIIGPGGPRDDIIPAMLSNGEFVVNAAATARNLALLQQINAQKFHTGGLVHLADGGPVGHRITPADLSRRASHQDDPATIEQLIRALANMRKEAKDVTRAENALQKARERSHAATKRSNEADRALEKAENRLSNAKKGERDAAEREVKRARERAKEAQKAEDDAAKAQEKRERELSKQRDELARATDRWKQKQQELIEQAKAIQDTVLEQGSLFGGQGTSVTVGGILAKLQQATKDARTFRKDITILRGRGLDEDLIQQLLEQGPTPEGVATAENLVHASRAQLRQINRQEARLEHIAVRTGVLGTHGGQGAGQNITVNVNLNGKIETTDVHQLARELPKHMRQAVKIALHA